MLLATSPSVTLRDSVEDGTCVLAAVSACLGSGSGQLPLWHCQASPAVALPIRHLGLTRVLLDVVGHKPKLDLVPWQRCRYRTCCMQLVSEKFSSHDNMHAEVVWICSHLCCAPCIMRGCWAAQALAVALPGSF